jgi:hypothetical protein
MNYKDQLLVDKFSEYSKDELLNMKAGCEKLLVYNNEYLVFLVSMILFCSPSIVLFTTVGAALSKFYFYNFVVAFIVFLLIKNNFVNKDLYEKAKEKANDIKFVLNNRD